MLFLRTSTMGIRWGTSPDIMPSPRPGRWGIGNATARPLKNTTEPEVLPHLRQLHYSDTYQLFTHRSQPLFHSGYSPYQFTPAIKYEYYESNTLISNFSKSILKYNLLFQDVLLNSVKNYWNIRISNCRW